MNLKNIDDNKLIEDSELLAESDRKTLVKLLHHLREIERRRLFSALGYQSLFQFVVERLKYSEDEAQRRISSMRLMRELPEVESKILDGTLKLTNICLAQRLFSKEKKAGRKVSTVAKREILEKVENKSTRDALKVVAAINPEMKKAAEFDFGSIDDEVLRERLLKLRGSYAHVDSNMSLKDLLHKLCDVAEADANKAPRTKAPKTDVTETPVARQVDGEEPKSEAKIEVYRRVWARDGGKCSRCSSTHAVQHDHIVPWAAGGETTYENLRLLCRNCNLRAAIEFYGRGKMANYVGESIRPYGARESFGWPLSS